MPRPRLKVEVDLFEGDAEILRGILLQFKADTMSNRAAGAAERMLDALDNMLPVPAHP